MQEPAEISMDTGGQKERKKTGKKSSPGDIHTQELREPCMKIEEETIQGEADWEDELLEDTIEYLQLQGA